MKKGILVIRPKTWTDALSLVKKLAQYVFRGQADEKWGLSTKLERVCWQNNFPTSFLKNREEVILREFQRRAHHYITSPPDKENKLEWLALIQHYGGATRLLDFTHSFYVATFFALENASDDAAVWAINEDYLFQHTDNMLHEDETIYDLHERSRKIIELNLAGNHEQKVVMSVVPERLNERISIQQGLFLAQGDIKHTFIENLATTLDLKLSALKNINNAVDRSGSNVSKTDYFEHGLIKIILPTELHNTALLDLDSMNINAASLFPGLEGFARSLNKYLRDVE